MKKYGIKIFAVFVILLFATVFAYTHSGGLDQNGGHWDRKRGIYHYHRRKPRSTPITPSRATPPKLSTSISEGDKPYTPTRLEWLALDLNAGIPTTSIKYYTTGKSNTIAVCIYYDSVTMSLEQRQKLMADAKSCIKNEANIRGWHWLKLEEEYRDLKQEIRKRER